MKKYLNRLFIDGLSGMSYGLFSTLIIGTIICQIGKLVGGNVVGTYLNAMGSVAKTLTGAGIGVGVACKLKSSPLVAVAAGVTGMIGAFPNLANEAFKIGAPGEPLGAFIAAYIAIEIGALVSGKTKVDIIVTPVCCIMAAVELIKVFTGGTHVYIEHINLSIGVFIPYKHCVLCGIHTANLRAIFLALFSACLTP